MACNDPDNPQNFPRNLFVWRRIFWAARARGMIFPEIPAGHAKRGDGGEEGCIKPSEITVRPAAPKGQAGFAGGAGFPHVHHLPVRRHRAAHRHLVRKDDLNTSDMHPFIHPLSEAVQPLWQAKDATGNLQRASPRRFPRWAASIWACKDLVLTPLMHDTPEELGQPLTRATGKRRVQSPSPARPCRR